MSDIEEAFSKTCHILFGRELHKIDDYAEWLTEHVGGKARKGTSLVSGKEVYYPSVEFFERIRSRMATWEEAAELGNKSLSEEEVGALLLSNAGDALSSIKTINPEIIYGKNIGTRECACYGPTQCCYRSTFCWFSKYVAYSYCPRDAEYLFGCSHVIDYSSFSMRCYSSTRITRCFEVDASTNCADCLFCHNCENVRESMFCFNAKNLQYAIGNVVVGREAYMKVKARVLAEIVQELEKEKKCRYDIYEIGCLTK